METYKKEEIEHYNNLARKWQKNFRQEKWESDAEYLAHGVFSSYQFADSWLKKHIQKGNSLLDYGCGNGIHSILPAKIGARVTGIDLSKASLAIARDRVKREGVEKQVTFKIMDCEALTFSNNTFDYVFDGGTFSSVDIRKAIPEIARVLKPKGTLIAIETLGHNPLTNLKRKINTLRGKRTSWALNHIIKMDNLSLLTKHFKNVHYKVFHLTSLLAFPFVQYTWGQRLLSILDHIDALLLKIPFLKRYAFKIVIIATYPKSSS